MKDIDERHPLELEAPRFGIRKPESRADRQGMLDDRTRVEAALGAFARDFTHAAAAYMETCVHCGQCAQACHFYVSTGDPKYTPVWKLEPFKQAYSRQAGPFAWVFRTFNLRPDVTIKELEAWQALIYDACTLCGRCTMACPMGIDIASLVEMARHGMAEAGLVPHELQAAAERAEQEGSPLGATPSVLRARIEWLADEHEVAIPLDQPGADILVTLSSIEIMKYPLSIVAVARVLHHMGASWTLSSSGYEATNFGLLSGHVQWQRDMSLKIIGAALACGAGTVILPECGHAYGALRWQGANMYGQPLPFRVVHISEFLAENVKNGRIRLNRLSSSYAFHDPCQVSRRGGATQAPREVLQGLGVEIREMLPAGDMNWCCGGGGGVVAIHRADELRYQAFRIKMRQVDDSGAQALVTSCSNCRQTFDDGQAHFGWDRKTESMLELVADNLAA